MANPNLEAGMKHLKEIAKKIKALLAWEQLKQAEAKPGYMPGFTFHDPVEDDLKNLYSYFLTISLEIHSILNDTTNTISPAKRELLKQQLLKIEKQIYDLNLNERFIKL